MQKHAFIALLCKIIFDKMEQEFRTLSFENGIPFYRECTVVRALHVVIDVIR